jgi:hypothetical protein
MTQAFTSSNTGGGRLRAPAAFRLHLLEGEHWRTGKRLRAEDREQEYTGLQLHRSGSGPDGQTGPRQFTGAFLEHLEQGVVSARIERALPAARWRYGKLQEALQAVREDCPDKSDALAYYLVPEGRRAGSVIAWASRHNVDAGTWRRWALEACDLVWEEMGGCW